MSIVSSIFHVPSLPDRRWSRSARRATRRVGLFAATMLTAGALLIAPGAVLSAPSASATDCPNAEVIFARGTSEPPGIGRVGAAFVDSLRQDTGQSVGVYAVNYPAGLLQRGGNQGAKDAISHIKSMADTCPNTKLVLGGYSQGATVMDIVTGAQLAGLSLGDALPAEYAKSVAAVAVFGNAATRAGGPISSQSQLFASKAIDLCNPGDPICHAGPGNQWSDHADGYVPGFTSQAANFVAARIPAPAAVAPVAPAPTEHVI